MSEKDWISTYFTPLASAAGADGLRDDVAVLDDASPKIVTVDALVEGIHFLKSDPIETVAQKLVRVNVSDCLASGAAPYEALLTLGWPSDRSETELRDFAGAFGQELEAWGISLLGGDTITHPGGLFLSLTLTGVCHAAGPVRRTGAQVGDDVWVTGSIGAAKLGFDAIEADEQSEYAAAYRSPHLPQRAISEVIAAYATASMDVSDGLLGDAKSLATCSESQLKLDLDTVDFAGNPQTIKEKLSLAAWGDDYQCLFTASAESRVFIEDWARQTGQKVGRIGNVCVGEGISITSCGNRINLPDVLGFEHN